jgi:hypothetical protein
MPYKSHISSLSQKTIISINLFKNVYFANNIILNMPRNKENFEFEPKQKGSFNRQKK